MLESLFIRILNMSLTGSMMILAVLSVRLLLRKAPKIFSYALWIVVLFRLLCPVSFESGFSLLGMLGVSAEEDGRVEYISESFGAGLQLGQEITATESMTAEDGLELQQSATAQEKKPIWNADVFQTSLRVASVIWMIGSVGLLLYGVASYMHLMRKMHFVELKEFKHPRSPDDTMQSVSAVMHDMTGVEKICRTDAVSTAFVLGFVRPRIYLPNNLEEREESYILLHEQVHVKRRDSLYRAAAYLALCLHWFNPLVWLAFHLSGKDMEMSCDEAVIRKVGNGVKKEYSNSLLALATGSAKIKGAPLAFGEGDMGSRIKNVLRYKKPTVILVAVVMLLCLAAAVFLLGNPKGKAEKPIEDMGGGADISSVLDSDVRVDSAIGQSGNTGSADTEDISSESEDTENTNMEATGEDIVFPIAAITPELLLEYGGNLPDGTYWVHALSIARSARGIDLYRVFDTLDTEWDDDMGLPFLAFDNDCTFLANRELDRIQYEEVSFDEFAGIVTDVLEYRWPVLNITFLNGLIVEASIQDAYFGYGFSSAPSIEINDNWYTHIQDITGLSAEEALEDYYTLVRTENADVSESAGEETIQIYTGNIGDGDSGIVIVRDSSGNLLITLSAHASRAGWNNIYLGETDGAAYLLEVHIEDRDNYGGYGYGAFRLGENGERLYIADTYFEFYDGGEIGYDDELFHTWADKLEYYLENSHLLLSTQEGEVRTEAVSEADKYNYETLRRG